MFFFRSFAGAVSEPKNRPKVLGVEDFPLLAAGRFNYYQVAVGL
jgi:hypothetical protein